MLLSLIDLSLGILCFHMDLACLYYANRQGSSESDLRRGDLDSSDLETALSFYIPSSNTGIDHPLKYSVQCHQ